MARPETDFRKLCAVQGCTLLRGHAGLHDPPNELRRSCPHCQRRVRRRIGDGYPDALQRHLDTGECTNPPVARKPKKARAKTPEGTFVKDDIGAGWDW